MTVKIVQQIPIYSILSCPYFEHLILVWYIFPYKLTNMDILSVTKFHSSFRFP